ncbi:hypothetical protein L0152_15695, partial [bacterium]|nr:hypothetical protein [bacterium]
SFKSFVGNILVVFAYYLFPSLIFDYFVLILIASLVVPALIATVANLVILIWLVKRIEKEKQIWLPMKIAIAAVLLSAFSLSIWGIYFSGNSFAMTEYDLRNTYYLGE